MRRDELWEEAVRVVGGDVRGLLPHREELERRWSEPQRGYHDLRHLDEVVEALVDLRPSAIDTDLEWAGTVFAAWFHDAVYDVAAPADNERLSSELARATLSGSGADHRVVELTCSLVEASATHAVDGTSGPQAAFHDADLWILSAPTERFDRYCEDVRREYASVPDDAYVSGRSAILRPFLERGSVYRTDHARTHWERTARDNLGRELDHLARRS